MAEDGARRMAVAPGVIVRGWGEDVSVVFSAATASTHLVSADAAAVLAAALVRPEGMELQSIEAPDDLIEALVQSGLLRHAG